LNQHQSLDTISLVLLVKETKLLTQNTPSTWSRPRPNMSRRL
jgi:hypothetical protein